MITNVRPVDAQYEDGVLRPTGRLDLRQGERVRLIVLRRSDPARWDLKRLAGAPQEDIELAQAGLGTWADVLDSEDQR